MKPHTLILCGLLLATPATLHADKKPEDAPVVWGAASGNAACVIFAEGIKTKSHFYIIASGMQIFGKLTLIETQNYTFDRKEVIETQENLDDLMQIAQKDRVKFVKIPEKYSPGLLEKARAACKADAQPPVK